MGAQALAHLALDFTLVLEQVVDCRVLVQPLGCGLRADLRHARDVVRGVAHQREVIDDLLRIDIELDLDAGAIERRAGHGVHQRDAVVHQLGHVLVARRDHDAQPFARGALGERADHVVGLDALDSQQRQAERLDRLDQRAGLCLEVVRHRRPVRLVLGEQIVAEGAARRVENDRDERRLEFLLQLGQHVEHAEHRPGRLTPGVRERRQCVEGPVQVRRAVHQDKGGGLTHPSHQCGSPLPAATPRAARLRMALSVEPTGCPRRVLMASRRQARAG